MLSISHQKFIRNITNIVQRIDKDLVGKLVTEDNKCFDKVCEKLESSCINTFNDIIKEKNDSADLIDAAVTIQRYYRGYKIRKEFNKKSKSFINLFKTHYQYDINSTSFYNNYQYTFIFISFYHQLSI